MANFSTIFSVGVTVTVLTGLASGIIYLIFTSIKWTREFRKILNDKYSESLRRRNFDLIKNDKKTDGQWLFKELKTHFQSTVAAIHKSGKQNVDVREVIEKLTENLIGGSVDNTNVTNLTNHPSYIQFMEKYQGVLAISLSQFTAAIQLIVDDALAATQELPNHAHSQLKLLIKKIIRDASSLPFFQKIQPDCNLEDLESKTYEDILATAILNNLVEYYQKKFSDNYSIHNHLEGDNTDTALVNETEDNSSDEDNCSSISTDTFSIYVLTNNALNERSDISKNLTEKNYTDDDFNNLNKYTFFDDKKAAFPEHGVDIINASSIHEIHEREMKINTWEENWLFQKKKLKRLHSDSNLVPMLVPSPKEEVKILIGSLDAEQTSDLSDCSDSDLIDVLQSAYKSTDYNNHSEKNLFNHKQRSKKFSTDVIETASSEDKLLNEATNSVLLLDSNADDNSCYFLNDSMDYQQEKDVDEDFFVDDHIPELNSTTKRSNNTLNETNEENFEEEILRNNISNVVYRAKGATNNFMSNPIFFDDFDYKNQQIPLKKIQNINVKSNVATNNKIGNDSTGLNIPQKPEVSHSIYNSLTDIRKKKK